LSSKESKQQLRDFINTPAGQWFIEGVENMRVAHYRKGEKDPNRASIELASAFGNNEVLDWIRSMTAISKS
jgi:hypothetical protein